MIHVVERELAGRVLSIETGRVAKQAGGAVWLQQGDTIVLATATMSREVRPGMDFFPLTCDYEERKYAVGRIPGGFVKRGGKPSEKAILTSRLIDRPIRPLFPEGMRNDVQVIAMPLSVDLDNLPDTLAIVASSAALTISNIPWNGPIGAVRVGRINGEFLINPTITQLDESDLDLVVAGTRQAIIMVEAGARFVSEADMLAAMDYAHEIIKQQCELQEELARIAGRPKDEIPLFLPDPAILHTIEERMGGEIRAAIQNPDKAARESAIEDLKKEIVARLIEEFPEQESAIAEAADKAIKKAIRKLIIEEGVRPDGRKPDEIRPITCQVGLLPRVHGSGLFTRGQTQVLTSLTLGATSEAQIVDNLEVVEVDERKHYMHFYNFPPYSVGEVRPLRGPGRREIGHGALAERALVPVLPSVEEFPYAMLLISEVLESNGSTSMASVCGSTLALMDAGVKLKAPVAGVAMGLMTMEDRFAVLTDIQGMEDFSGDMDFKVAGTAEGITAIQMDTKIQGIPREVMVQALEQARQGRLQILAKMLETIPEPRPALSRYAPSIFTIEINPERIGEVIGPGGKTIKKITADTGAQIDIQQDGKIFIAAVDQEAGKRAAEIILSMVGDIEVGSVFTGRVTRMIGMGAFVEIAPGREGLVHVSHLRVPPVRRPEEAVKIGDELKVRVIEVDQQGRINLSAIHLDQPFDPSMARRIDDGRGGRPGTNRERGPRSPERERGRPPAASSTPDDDEDNLPKARFRPRR
ncbi:MAG: polyribonucleotide nucleotidyltransferase [Chloroherpetonaceae bacterium]|nr:polyribonucleotide nucleotidyltransferase [Chthonomonadaceae bacterium]MDW8206195.1 polyribonucleotide nucleotidyltransferase [Chloroherpetonaceae bacterium]